MNDPIILGLTTIIIFAAIGLFLIFAVKMSQDSEKARKAKNTPSVADDLKMARDFGLID